MTVDPTDPLIGTLLGGRYLVEERIARGGMASVYRGRDTRLNRPVALKVMRAHLASDEGFVTRFQREAQSGGNLSHANIVSVFDYVEDDGVVFLALEYVPGRTLREVVAAGGPMTPRAALDIIDPVLDALAAAHQAGLMHRDIKPENVIVRDDGVVKVADFGLARAVTSETATSATTEVMGTLSYISPEQIEHNVVTTRSDVYSAGLVLWEMLTGRKAFAGDSIPNVLWQHLNSGVPRLSEVRPGIPPSLDTLVAQATAKDPLERPADAVEFRDEVRHVRSRLSDAVLDARMPTAPPPGTPADGPVTPGTTTSATPGATPGTTTGATAGTGPSGSTPGPVADGVTLPLPSGAALATGAGAGSPTATASGHDRSAVSGVDPSVDPGADTAVLTVGQPGQPVRPTPRRTAPPRTAAPRPASPQAGSRGSSAVAGGAGNPTDPASPAGRGAIPRTSPGGARPDRPTTPPAPKRSRRGILTVVAVMLLAFAAGAAAWWFVLGPGATTTIPTVASLSQDAAVSALQAAHLDAHVTPVFSETVAKGVVVDSDPRAGGTLHRGDTVTLQVSKGPERYDVPSLTGKSRSQAKNALEKVHLALGTVSEAYDETIAEGKVIASTPPEGTPMKRGQPVAVVLSLGPRPIDVPNLTGTTVTDATTLLEGLGLKLTQGDDVYSTDVPEGQIAEQEPADGTLQRDGTVTVHVSKGPEMVEVPSVYLKSTKDATDILEGAGFKVKLTFILGGPLHTVTGQTPGAGEKAPKGSVVELTVV